METVETYLDRAQDALRMLGLAEGPEAKREMLEIAKTWIATAERRARTLKIDDPDIAAAFAGVRRNLARAAEALAP